MNSIHEHDEERLAALLRELPPAPEGWTRAAQELPWARQEIEEIAARVEADKDFRAAVTADLEAALAAAGYELDPVLLPVLKSRISAP
jgi:hypothetical protein